MYLYGVYHNNKKKILVGVICVFVVKRVLIVCFSSILYCICITKIHYNMSKCFQTQMQALHQHPTTIVVEDAPTNRTQMAKTCGTCWPYKDEKIQNGKEKTLNPG